MTVIPRETIYPRDPRDPRDANIPVVPGDPRDHRDHPPPHTIFLQKKVFTFYPPIAIVP